MQWMLQPGLKENAYEGFMPDIQVFYNYGLAVLNHLILPSDFHERNPMPAPVLPKNLEALRVYYGTMNATILETKAGTVTRLKELGYRISAEESGEAFIDDTIKRITPEDIFFSEYKKDHHEEIRSDLEALLAPIMHANRDVEAYRFAVYYPSFPYLLDDKPIVMYHKYKELFWMETSAGLVDFDALARKYETLDSHLAIAISSEVRIRQAQVERRIRKMYEEKPEAVGLRHFKPEKHMMMIDFASRERLRAEFKKRGVSSLGQGFFVDSGNSYHFYSGAAPLEADELHGFYAEIALSASVGKDWPRLQEEQGFSLLRVTPCSDKPFAPEIVKKEDL